MQYSENLNLPIMEDNDPMLALYSQGNAIIEGLEESIGTHVDDIENIPEMRNDIEELNNTVESLNTSVELLNTMQTKEKVIINGTEQIVDKVVAKVSITGTGNYSEVVFKGVDDDDDHRHALVITNASIFIDMTELFDIDNESEIILKSVLTYQNGYQYMNTRNNSPMEVVCLGKIPNDNNLKLVLANHSPVLYSQTRQTTPVEYWNPSARPSYEYSQEVIVTLEFYKLV